MVEPTSEALTPLGVIKALMTFVGNTAYVPQSYVDEADALLARCAPVVASLESEQDVLRCNICGFVIDRRFEATKPSLDFTMVGRK